MVNISFLTTDGKWHTCACGVHESMVALVFARLQSRADVIEVIRG